MDLTQKKLTKAEWLNVEIPVGDSEKKILELIVQGYHNVNLKMNYTTSISMEMKVRDIENIDAYLYTTYFEPIVKDHDKKYGNRLQIPMFDPKLKASKHKIRKAEQVKIGLMDKKIKQCTSNIYEFVLMDFVKQMLESRVKNTSEYAFYLYTLIQLQQNSIQYVNLFVTSYVQYMVNTMKSSLNMYDVLSKSYEFIEKNKHLLKYADLQLFDHQKQIFNLFKHEPLKGKFVLYTAPTGTGKTLTPLGLSEGHRVIFICAARHIGLALAKSAISVQKRIAIAFGCETADDIRLHYYAASSYSRNKRTGGIGKVDNSVGDKVQIMICDVQSYIIAMHYMMAFSDYDPSIGEGADHDIITYWDEPTISMDYEEHHLHEKIQYAWKENKVSKMVFSCATLPKQEEIISTLNDFRVKFEESTIHTINSYDCRKSISLLSSENKSSLPHLIYSNRESLALSLTHCNENRSLLRYFDLVEIIRFIQMSHLKDAIPTDYKMESYFEGDIAKINMNSLKLYYLQLLNVIDTELYAAIHNELKTTQQEKFSGPGIRRTQSHQASRIGSSKEGSSLHRMQSISAAPPKPSMKGVLLTTEDAHTLTDGPTIYLVENVELIARFYIQQSKIPQHSLNSIMKSIEQNNVVQKKITDIENTMEEKLAKLESTSQKDDGKKGGKSKTDKIMNRDSDSSDMRKLQDKLSELRQFINPCSLDQCYIPNTMEHQHIWVQGDMKKNAFIPTINEENVQEIMMLDVTNEQKLLLLMGIGMFLRESEVNPRYLEIMKKMAYEQQLFIIIASSDYIYGTNYQFCHGFIGKDLTQMTQQKTIQALGRIGRNQTQQEYTVRFRKDEMIKQLFEPVAENKEAIVMNKLFG